MAGSPAYLTGLASRMFSEARKPETALAFLEVLDGGDDPAAYVTEPGAREPLFDYAWFTPHASDEDPCERFRPSLERLGTEPAPAQ